MSESQFNQRVKNATKQTSADEEFDYVACSFGRIGVRPQLAVTFRRLSGEGYTFAYSHLYSIVDHDANSGFVVEFTQHRVMVDGRNLRKMLLMLGDQKVREIREIDELQSQSLPPDEPVVTRLEVAVKSPTEG